MNNQNYLPEPHTVVVGSPVARANFIRQAISGAETAVHLIKSSANPLEAAPIKPGLHGLRVSMLDQVPPIDVRPTELTIVADVFRLLRSRHLVEILTPLHNPACRAVFGTHDAALIGQLAQSFNPRY